MQRVYGLLTWEVDNSHIGTCVYILVRHPFFVQVWLGVGLEEVVMVWVGCSMDRGGGARTWLDTWSS